MDQERFDQITRTLASGQSRRGLLKGLAGTALGGMIAAAGLGGAASAQKTKVSFCHVGDGGSYEYITVSANAAPAHRRHGDVENPNFASDVKNCGACGNVCTAPADASPTCGENGCGFTCNADYELNESGDGCVAADTPPPSLCDAVDCKAQLGDNDCTTTECSVIDYFGVPVARCYNDIYELHGEPCLQGGAGICSAGVCIQ